ncbi:hypothetical protein D8B26_000585 [Coccidioides posadasii str. Silveira]|uniref:uncharacterized protein n=1 Tax=Coccidioides posadasii (strain RMSCC 757 / Silveira) TaxID=443226 RepID=UPI001BEFB389|nr:hypothetical protein D8B26_000585 [Coccidioides posadasii str. Silveira]
MPIEKSKISFTNQHARSDSAEKAIVTFSAQLDARGADSAKVRCTHDGQSWHAGGTDPKEPEHLTVEFKDAAGNHITTKHVYR